LICLDYLLANALEGKTSLEIVTQALSEMDRIRGAYCEGGSVVLGAPRPDMPETLCLLATEGAGYGRTGRPGVPLPLVFPLAFPFPFPLPLPMDWRLVAELELERTGGGVPNGRFTEEVEGVAAEECWPWA
jgi:hypothetical protein